MDHLELVRVNDTGTELVLRAPNGTEYLLPIDEQLKRATKESRPAAAAPVVPPVALSPREIQMRIRAGATAAEVAESSGTPLENILRYEGPVLAERDYIARQARDIEVSAPLAHEGYRAAFGDEPASLGEMVRTRLRSFGVDPKTLVWDAWKIDSGTWTVVARFAVQEDSAAVGEEPPAEWTFHPARRHLENANRWGQVLSEWEPWDVLPTQRRLVPVGDRPFDVEDGQALAVVPDPESEVQQEDAGLLDVLSRRRGTRVGEDIDGDDALAHLIARSRAEREKHGQPAQQHGDEPRPGPWGVPEEAAPEPEPAVEEYQAEQPHEHDRAWPPLRRVPDPVPASRSSLDELMEDDSDSPRPHKKRRSQVPSWDEIVFGRSAKGDEDED